jgi:hypothetical protein
MPDQHIYKPNQTRAGFLLAEKKVWFGNILGRDLIK